MKKVLLLLTVAITALSLQAAPVDKAAAEKVAKNYLANEMYAGKMMAPAALNPVLVKTEYGSNTKLNLPVYYIYNTSTTFLVISGDDRAEQILMVGDKPLNMDRIPDGLQYLLDCYKEQMDFLQANPNIRVERPSDQRTQLSATTYGPLLTAEWDQEAPYNNLCKFTYNNRTYTCLTGCPATSAAMVLYYWKYPTTQIPALASYTSTLDISSTQSVSYTYPALDPVTFDWGNMKDKYTNGYTTAQATAVATLMRYVGQAEHMMYGTSSAGGSGIYTTDTQIVVDMFKNWGYDNSCAVKYKSNYSSTNWANLIIGELAAGRPLVYNGVSGNAGHAFNVDGYRDSDSKYHVNFGWSGDGNNWFAMNAFSYGGYTFSSNQQAIVGIQPPGGQTTTPELSVSPTSLSFETTAGGTVTKTFTVNAENLYSDVTITKGGNSYFSVSPTTLTKEQAMAGATVTVTYNPSVTGNHTGTITVASNGATSQTVSLTGTSATAAPVITPSTTSLSFSTQAGTPVTQTYRVTAANLTSSIRLAASGTGFTVSPAVILKSNAALSTTGVEVTVTYNPTTAGNHTGAITMTSDGAETKTVSLTGNASEPPRAITVDPSSLSFSTDTENPVTKTFNVTGTNLTGALTLSLSGGNGAYTITPTTLTAAQAAAGATVTVTYAPTAAGNHNATVTVSGGGATSKTVSLTGTATQPVRTISANPSSLSFNALVGETATQTFVVNGQNLNSNLTLSLNDPNGVYTFSPATLTAAQAMAGATVTVTYTPTAYGNQSATITISGGGADAVNVSLNGVATFVKYAPVMLPANETYISLTQFRADWTDETLAENVTSYTLEVSPKVVEPELLNSLSGSAYPNSYADITLSAPWASLNVRGGNNAIYIKNNYLGVAQGYITYTIPEGYTNATFTVMVKSINNYNGVGDVTISTPQTAAVSHNFVQNDTFYWLVTASSGEKITIISNDASYSPDMSLIAVYSGDARPATLMASETGDANYRLIEGITEKYYTVKDLAEAGTFLYRVKALYADNTESDWSNIEEVTLFENAHPYAQGDVNHDGFIDINDVTDMITFVLNGGEICMICADMNNDTRCDINDVTTLIDRVLNGATLTLMGKPVVVPNVEK